MAKVMENLSTVNSLLRTVLAIVLTAGASGGLWFGYRSYNRPAIELAEKSEQLATARHELDTAREQLAQQDDELLNRAQRIEALGNDILQKQVELRNMSAALRMLKTNHRVARLSVTDQSVDTSNGDLYTTVQFEELGLEGEVIDGPKGFRLRGDVAYIDSWVVKFEDQYVEQSDLQRGTSLVLFRRLFGEYQAPRDGFLLDVAGRRPGVYSGDAEITAFEEQVWGDLWRVANDAELARRLGVRAAHGEAPSIKLQRDGSYLIELRASDGLSIIPEAAGRAPTKPPA